MKKQAQPNRHPKHTQFVIDELQRLAQLGIWEFDWAAQRLTWSGEVSRIFGLESRETGATYEAFLVVVHPEDRAWVEATYRAAMRENRDEFELEHRIFHARSGEIRHVYQKCLHERDQQGKIVRSSGIVQDVTERKRAAEALVESESRFRLLAENSTDMISHHDAQGHYLYVSPACRVLLGYSPEELIGHSAFEFIHPDDFQQVEQSRQGIIEQPVVSTTTFRARRKTGEYIWLETTSRTLLNPDTGEVQGLHAASRNVTERKQAQEALHWQAHFQRLLMDISLTYINLSPAEVSAAMNTSLAELGAFVKADRAYIFAYDFPAQICLNTHEWCDAGITPQIERLQAVPLETIPAWVAAHTQGQPIYVREVSALPAGGLKDLLTGQQIKSLLTVPLMDGPVCTGFIGFDSVRQSRCYSEDEQRLLRVFAELLVNVHRRQQAEENLNQVRANLQAIIENTLDNIWAINTHYEILYTNEVFAQAFLATFGVLLTPGVNILNSLPEALCSTWKERYDRAFNGERFVFLDAIEMGEVSIHVEVAVNPIVQAGQVTGASFFGRDVTARKRGEQALEVALAKYKTLFETFPLGLSVTDQNGKILETNTIAEKMLAVPQTEHLQREIDSPIWRIIREDGTPMPVDEFAGVQALKERCLVEDVRMGILKPGNVVTWLNVTAAPLSVPGYGVVVTYSDITERKKMEDALRIKEWAISDSINAIALADLTGSLTFVNPAFLKMWGYLSAAEILERNSTEFWQSNIEAADVLVVLQQQGHWRGELLGKRQDGSQFVAEVSASLVLDEAGQPLSLLGVFEDITERKRIEDSLRESEKKYRQLSSLLRLMADTMPDMLWAKNLNQEYIFVNQALCEQLLNAADTEEPLGQTDLFFALRERAAHLENPDWHTFGELCQDTDSMTLQALKPMQFDEFGNVRGEFLYLDVHKAPLYDEDGQLLGLVGSARDVTARKRAEAALRESAERAQLQRNALTLLTLNTSIAQRNIAEALKEITVLISEVLKADRASVWLLSEDSAELKCLMLFDGSQPPRATEDVFLASDFPVYFEALQQESLLNASDARSDPRTREFASYYLPRFKIGAMLDAAIQREGRLVGVICAEHTGGARPWQPDESSFLSAIANFTAQLFAQAERKHAEEALRESEARYRSLFTQTLDGVYRSTHAGKFVDLNPAMVKMFGYSSQEEMFGIDIQTELYFDPAERDSHILETGEQGQEVYRMRRQDGSEIWVEDHGSYIYDDQGEIIFHEGILRDVTDRKQAELHILHLNAELEQRVKERTAQLEEANRELEAFSYSVSHDLRAPLRAIDGFSRILWDECAGQISEEGRVLLNHVRSSATRMGVLIDDLLRFSRLGRQPLRTQIVDMTTIVQTALGTLQAEMEGQPPQIRVGPLPVCQGDPSLLTQVWVNLLSNAVKYSRNRAEAQIEIGSYSDCVAGEVFYIKDNGVGFDMRYAGKLFGVFQRLHSESEFEGTGVGLALVHRIVTQHGGRIWAEAEVDQGATFYFTITGAQRESQTPKAG